MWRNLLMTSAVLVAIVFFSCRPEYIAPIEPDCLETWDADTTMIHPAVYLDHPGQENGVLDAFDIIFSNYDVQLYNASNDEMMEQGHVPNWMGHEFKPVVPGKYYLRFMIPEGFICLKMEADAGVFDSDLDSDVVDDNGFTDIFEIQCHEQITNIKAIIQKQ